MISSKLFAASLLFPSSLLMMKKDRELKAECEGGSSGAEKGAQDLDQIFAGQEGGMPPDPEEIQEMLMKAQGKTIRYFYDCLFL